MGIQGTPNPLWLKMRFLNYKVHICHLLDVENTLHSFTNYWRQFREDFSLNFTYIFLKIVCWILWGFLVHTRCIVNW